MFDWPVKIETWEDLPERRESNGGWGMCNTGYDWDGLCVFGGIGCNVDHEKIAGVEVRTFHFKRLTPRRKMNDPDYRFRISHV